MKGNLKKVGLRPRVDRAGAKLAAVRSSMAILWRILALLLFAELLEALLEIYGPLPAYDWWRWADSLIIPVLMLPLLYALILKPARELAARQAEFVAEARFETVAQAAHEGIFIIDLDLTIRFVNRAGEQMFGYERDTLIGQNVRQLVSEEARIFLEKQTELIRTTGDAPILHAGEMEITAQRKGRGTFALEFGVGRLPGGNEVTFVVICRDITQRRLMEEFLRESEAQFRMLLDMTPAMVWMADARGRSTYVSKGWLEFTGRTREQELSEGWAVNIHPEDRERAQRYVETAREQRLAIDHEYRIRRANGEYCWVLDRGRARFGPGGEFVGYIGACLDITERKEAERKLEENAARLAALMENNPLGIVTVDEKGRVLMCNPAFRQLFQFSQEEIAGAILDEVVSSPEHLSEARRITEENMAGKQTFAITRRKRKDGSLVEVELHAVPLIVHGRIVGAYGLYQDLSQRRELESKLRESEARFRLAADSVPVQIWMRGADGQVTFSNRECEEFTGYSADELREGAWLESIHPEDRAEVLANSQSALKTRANINHEHRMRHRSGEFRWVHTQARPRYAPDGSLEGYTGCVVDVTERKMAEDELRASEKKLRELLEALPVGVRIAQETKVVFANTADARMHGYSSPAEMLGHSSLEHIVREDWERAPSSVKSLTPEHPEAIFYQLRRVRLDKSEFPAGITVTSITFEGQPSLLVVIQDLTDRKRLSLYEQLLPVCCMCGKIRDDEGLAHGEGKWDRLDHYVAKYSDAQISHTFCPGCLEEYKRQEGLK